MLRTRWISLLILCGVTGPLIACLWDYDTLQVERSRFPGTLELIVGHFARHSQAFYQWRIEDRKKRLEETGGSRPPNWSRWQDDLAVAYDKTGQSQKAIAIMLEKEASQPGLYETQANLGTFYIHSGQLAKGLEHIKKAIQINPDAHFGRELYQQRLVEYVLKRKADGWDGRGPLGGPNGRFDQYLINLRLAEVGKKHLDHKERQSVIQPALKGISGMMRFGNYDSPILQEALGDLLSSGHSPQDDAKRLAARAYLQASYRATSQFAATAYRERAKNALRMQTVRPKSEAPLKLREVEAKLQTEIEEANKWVAAIAAEEARWISEGVDVDRAFTEKYLQSEAAPLPNRVGSTERGRNGTVLWIVVGLGASGVFLVIVSMQRRRKSSDSSAHGNPQFRSG